MSVLRDREPVARALEEKHLRRAKSPAVLDYIPGGADTDERSDIDEDEDGETDLRLIAGACGIAAFGLFEIVYGPMPLTRRSRRASGAS
jgi:hypothetical protein